MSPKPAPSQMLRSVLSGLGTRLGLIYARIDKAEAEGRISKPRAEELRQMVREALR